MDGNKVIENLLERIKQLTKENAFLAVRLQEIETQFIQLQQKLNEETKKKNKKEESGNNGK